MADSSGKSWWEENVEDPYWEQRDKDRALYQDNPVGQVQHDIGVGVEKGIYYGAKDMAVGLFEVAKWAVLLVAHDPATEKATTEAVIRGAKGAWGLAKDVLAAEYGTPEQKREVNERWAKSVAELGKAVSDKVKRDWDEASKQGKEAELVSKYVSRVGFEAATFLVGAGEASAVAKAGEAAEVASKLSKAEKLGEVVTQCGKAAQAADDLSDAARAAKALEEANALDAVKAATRPSSLTSFSDDVSNIARGAEWPQEDVAAVKKHWLEDEHLLVDDANGTVRKARFDVDERSKSIWDKAAKGDELTPEESAYLKKLLQHEKREAEIMKDRAVDLNEAFKSGRVEELLSGDLRKMGKSEEFIARLLENEPKPMTPYRYSHLVAHFTGGPNP